MDRASLIIQIEKARVTIHSKYYDRLVELGKKDETAQALYLQWHALVQLDEQLKREAEAAAQLCPMCDAATGGPEPEDPFTDE